jgi:hypothetical protein
MILCFLNCLMVCLVLFSFTSKQAFLVSSKRVYMLVFNISGLYSWSARFEFGPGHQLSCLECSWIFSVPWESCGEVPRIRPLPLPSVSFPVRLVRIILPFDCSNISIPAVSSIWFQSFLILLIFLKYSKKTLWPLVRKRTIPTERPPHIGEVCANSCG